MIEKTVGTALTTVTRWSAIQDQNRWAENFLARTTVPPTRSALITETNWASVWKSGRKQRIRNPSSKPRALAHDAAALRKLRCVIKAPFGGPVVPEVYGISQ